MFSTQELTQMCEPISEDKAYYRPYLCKGELSKAQIFLVGINPATPIYSTQVSIGDYVEMILDYNKFEYQYRQICNSKKGQKSSRTRLGINSFVEWLAVNTESSVVETNVNAYPTPNQELLNKESAEIKQKGYNIFYTLLTRIKPRILIFHSLAALTSFDDIIRSQGHKPNMNIDFDKGVRELEEESPFYKFAYDAEHEATVMACRHLMYYGKSGDSYSAFKEKILEVLKRNM